MKRSALFHMSQCKNLIKISDFAEKKKEEKSLGGGKVREKQHAHTDIDREEHLGETRPFKNSFLS